MSEEKPKLANGGLIPKREWEAGDEAVVVKLSEGYLYVDQATVKYYGLDFLKKLSGAEIVTVVDDERKNGIPEGCTCAYEFARAIHEEEYSAVLTRKEPDCPIHGMGCTVRFTV